MPLKPRPSERRTPDLIAIITDLIFATKVTSTAQSLHVTVAMARSLEKLDSLLNASHKVVLLDLNSDGIDVIQAIHRIKAADSSLQVIAFASHVEVDLIAAARSAGADDVMARSAFVTKLPAILQHARTLEQEQP